ncbi:MAG: hypothetical protein AB8B57_03840 [Congregibacter sp.]
MTSSATTNLKQLRNFAAIITTVSGSAQSIALWLLPTTPELLLTALCGAIYVLLGLGLFGIARFSLLLAIVFPLLRSWFGWWPLELQTWEFLRVAADIAIAVICVPVLWSSLDPSYREISPGLLDKRAHTSKEHVDDA